MFCCICFLVFVVSLACVFVLHLSVFVVLSVVSFSCFLAAFFGSKVFEASPYHCFFMRFVSVSV